MKIFVKACSSILLLAVGMLDLATLTSCVVYICYLYKNSEFYVKYASGDFWGTFINIILFPLLIICILLLTASFAICAATLIGMIVNFCKGFAKKDFKYLVSFSVVSIVSEIFVAVYSIASIGPAVNLEGINGDILQKCTYIAWGILFFALFFSILNLRGAIQCKKDAEESSSYMNIKL